MKVSLNLHRGHMGKLHSTIQQALSELGCKPMQFEKPLKNTSTLVRLTKVIKPRNLAERSQAVGWCLGSLIDRFEKQLFRVKNLTVCNERSGVTVTAVVRVTCTTFEGSHIAWLDSTIKTFTTVPVPSKGYCWTRLHWSWDTAERISEVTGSVQIDGSGDSLPLECENAADR